MLSWDDLIVVEEGTQGGITYDILDTNDMIVAGFSNLVPDAAGRISLAGINAAAVPKIKVRANLTDDDGSDYLDLVGPELCQWVVSFTMERLPSFTFRVRVDNPVIGRTTIDNVVTIATTTPELTTTNNTDDDSIMLRTTDVEIDKRVDQTAALAGFNILYTLEYAVNGPQGSVNTILTDTLADECHLHRRRAARHQHQWHGHAGRSCYVDLGTSATYPRERTEAS